MLLGYQVDQDGKEDAQPIPSKYRGTSMNHIKLYRQGKGCEMPDGSEYLMVIAHQIDAQGEWVSTDIQLFGTWHELQIAIREMVASGEGIVVRASPYFEGLANDLGLTLVISEWGNL